MALVAGDERVRQAHADSVKVALSELETFAACRGKEILGRLKRHDFTGELCAAICRPTKFRVVGHEYPTLSVH
jgi:hypothetical protein